MLIIETDQVWGYLFASIYLVITVVMASILFSSKAAAYIEQQA